MGEEVHLMTARLLRISAIIFLLFTVGHWFFAPWVIGARGLELEALTATAQTVHPVFGFSRSYWDFHVGFGHMAGVFLLMEVALLWLLAGDAARPGGASSTRRLLGVLVVADVAITALQVAYFFWPPIVLSVVGTAILAVSWLRLAPSSQPLSTRPALD